MPLNEKKTEALSLALKPTLLRKLKAEAKRNNRKVNDFVNILLEERYQAKRK